MNSVACRFSMLCLLTTLLVITVSCAAESTDNATVIDRTDPIGQVPTKTSLPASDNTDLSPDTATSLEAADRLAEFHLVGGFAGFCDHLVVYVDGSASLFNECSEKQKDFQVGAEAFNQLVAMAAEYGPFSHNNEDNPSGPDSLATQLILYGQGTAAQQPNEEQRDALLKLLTSILIQGRL